MLKLKGYVKPKGQYIDAGERKLYRLEAERTNAIRKAAEELARVLGHDVADFWKVTLPEELLAVLESWDRAAAYLAAKAFVEKKEVEGVEGDEKPEDVAGALSAARAALEGLRVTIPEAPACFCGRGCDCTNPACLAGRRALAALKGT